MNFFESQRNQSFTYFNREKSNEHEEELKSVDVFYERGFILTSCADGIVKVWNSKKEIIRSIKFNDDIT